MKLGICLNYVAQCPLKQQQRWRAGMACPRSVVGRGDDTDVYSDEQVDIPPLVA